MQKDVKVIAAFDFDGTITYGDSAIYFLLFTSGYFKTCLLLLKKLPIFINYALGRSTRQKTKESVFQAFFEGKKLEELQKWGAAFAKESLPKHVRPEALPRIQWHLSQGHRCILISASIETYLKPWADSVGFNDVVTSRLAVDSSGRVTGKLVGANCRNHEKVRRLQELVGPLDDYEIYAYGDSDGDKELLEIADHSFYRTMP